MSWVFRVAYETVFGESLWLELVGVEGKSRNRERIPMVWKDSQHWEVEVPRGALLEGYRYVLRREGEQPLELAEWGGMRELPNRAESKTGSVYLLDDWRSAGNEDRVYESGLFRVIEGGERVVGKIDSDGSHEFHLSMSRISEGMVPCLIGGIGQLGDWDYTKALPMVEVAENQWQAVVNFSADQRVEYKYGLYDPVEGKAVLLEDGAENRVLDVR
ncbi:MAG: carbohydrate-binding module family 20 domain-containing protein, partial [Akkermansiaceae bacterium]